MKFALLKVLDIILDLYKMPRNKERFDKYLYLLQGINKNDLILPIAAFNPMGKELAINKVETLIALNAEQLVDICLEEINLELNDSHDRNIQVAINLIDDVEGSWSNYAVTDYKNKFELDGLIKRDFCTPIFWTSESIKEKLIRQRIKEYVYRTIHWIQKEKPRTLYDCFEQEVNVYLVSNDESTPSELTNFALLKNYYEHHLNSNNYNLIFNFFYGDKESENLNYPTYGIPENGGLEYVKYVAMQRKKV